MTVTVSLAESWCHGLQGIADMKLRVDYLRAQLLSYSIVNLALALREIFERAPAGYARAQRVVAALVPGLAHVESDEKRRELMHFLAEGDWSDLQDWLGAHPGTSTLEAPRPEQDIARAGDRPLTLGERKSLARQPTRTALARLLRDPHPAVVALLLDNSAMTEDRVVRITARRPGDADVLRRVAAHPQWCVRPRVRSALVQHPRTPPYLAAPLVCLLPGTEQSALLEVPRTPEWVRRAATRAQRSRPA